MRTAESRGGAWCHRSQHRWLLVQIGATFGESAPVEQLFEEFGFTVENVVAKAKELFCAR
nr:hypothetical protein [Buttiauxella warmboldiae]